MRQIRTGLGAACALFLSSAAAAGPHGVTTTGAQVDPLALGSRYRVIRVDSPASVANARMGWLGIASAGDIDGDDRDDVLLPETDGAGRIHVISGATGQLIRTLAMPDPADAPDVNDSAGSFIYPAQLPDVASCTGGAANQACSVIGAGDGVPEVLVGATGADIEVPGQGLKADLGRAYVFDGATGALLKRVQMPEPDLVSEALRAPKSFSFGRSILAPFSPFETTTLGVQMGDIDGSGEADFVVGNPTFYESGPSMNPSCDPGPCPGSGRVYVYRGEDIAGSASDELDAPLRVIKNPMAQSGADHERFGHATMAVGDVGQCNAVDVAENRCTNSSSSIFDGRPEFVVSAHATDWPDDVHDSGVVWMIDGGTGAILRRYVHPSPQPGALFGYHSGAMPTGAGHLGGSLHADFFVPAVAQLGQRAGQGRGWVLNGQFTTFSGTVVLSQLDDPTPQPGANFGAPSIGIGDVAGDAHGELLVGQSGPLWPADFDEGLGDVHVFDVSSGQPLLTLDDPDNQPGSGFGQGVASLGDLNDDGFVDFGVSAGFYDGVHEDQGRLYIFQSMVSPTKVDREATLRLRAHLRVQGTVTAADGFESCTSGVPVVIKRNGATVRRVSTDADGGYAARVRDRQGRYRAVVPRVDADDVTCKRAKSKSVRHRHL